MPRREHQAIANIVKQRDERAHQQEAGQEQARQPLVAPVQAEVDKQRFRAQRCRAEMTRFRQNFPEHQGRSQCETADDRQRNTPAKEVREYPAQQTPAHAANRVPADVQPHRKGDEARVDLLAEIGHPDCRHAAER